MRLTPKIVEHAERGPVGCCGQHRAGGEVDADADHVGGVDSGLGEEPRDRLLKRPHIVFGILERPVRLEVDVVVGCRQVLVDHAVAVRVDGRPELTSVGAVDEERTSRFRAEVDADRVPAAAHVSLGFARCGSTTTFSPRRSMSASNACRHSESA